LEPFSAGQIGVPRGAKHVIAGFGTAPGFAIKKTVSPATQTSPVAAAACETNPYKAPVTSPAMTSELFIDFLNTGISRVSLRLNSSVLHNK
jgi:hypothetical protein